MKNNVESINLTKVEKLSNFTVSNSKVNDQILNNTYKNYSKKPQNLKTEISLRNKIYKDIYLNAEKNYNKKFKDKIKLKPKERELYVDSVYSRINKKIKSLKRINPKRGRVNGTLVKFHERKGTKGVRSHYRKTRRNDLI